MNMFVPDYYRIADGRVWSVKAAGFVEAAPEMGEALLLYDSGQPVGYLRDTLKFYGYPLGELAGAEVRRQLAGGYRVDRQCLCPSCIW
jgi:hypothetical protein